jgi:ribosomal-protein-alanine N-acetyltransferase
MRPLALADADALHEAYRDADLMRWWSSGPHASIEETQGYLAARIDDADWQIWAITLAEDDRAIGTVAAMQRRPGVFEVAFLLVRREWSKGYAGEAVARLLDLLFEEGARRVFADADPDNDASIRLLQRLGFRREGVLRAEWQTHIGVRDTVILGLLRDEWRAPVAPAATAAVSNALLAPLWATGFMLGLTGVGLALVPKVPRAIAVAVVALGLLHAVAAIVLRRRSLSSSASTRA